MIDTLTLADVLRAYRGRPGCMCGCIGDYFTPAVNRAEEEADTGRPCGDEDIDDARVEQILRRVSAESGDRLDVVYLTATARARLTA